MDKLIEIKVRRENDELTWETRKVEVTLNVNGQLQSSVVSASKLFGKVHKGVEIRYNYKNSPQGHYHSVL